MNDIFIFLVSILVGGVAALSGFGIGSLLTPVFAWSVGTKLAVALVVVPHFVATLARVWWLREALDRHVFLTFGLASAAGGLVGAYLHTVSSSQVLSIVFGLLLILASVGLWTGFWNRLHFGASGGLVAGVVSGVLGGLVGNQGGIRTAALLGVQVRKEAFIATGTAAALVVDLVRLPIYVHSQWEGIQVHAVSVVIACVGTLIGTWFGVHGLRRLPETWFRPALAGLLFVLGVSMLVKHL